MMLLFLHPTLLALVSTIDVRNLFKLSLSMHPKQFPYTKIRVFNHPYWL